MVFKLERGKAASLTARRAMYGVVLVNVCVCCEGILMCVGAVIFGGELSTHLRAGNMTKHKQLD